MDVDWERREGNEPEPPYGDWLGEARRYVHRLTGDADLADDVAQEAVMRLISAAGAGTIQSPRAWLYRTATNLVRDTARRDTVRRLKVVPVDTDSPSTPEDQLIRSESVQQVREALERIPARDRQLLILRESGFRYREIADVVGVKTESVPVLVSRAIARFRSAYMAGVKQ